MALTAANTYSGGTTVNAGTLLVGNSNALGTGGLIIATTAIAKLQSGLTAPVQLPSLTIAASALPIDTLDASDSDVVVNMTGELAPNAAATAPVDPVPEPSAIVLAIC